jgi:hypothetical protein
MSLGCTLTTHFFIFVGCFFAPPGEKTTDMKKKSTMLPQANRNLQSAICNHKRRRTMAGREHTLDRSKIHYKWDNSLPPAIEIEPGDTVHCETEEVSDGQIKPGMPA